MVEEPRVCTVKMMKHRRITIPKAIEETLRLKEGDVVEVSVKRVIPVAESAGGQAFAHPVYIWRYVQW